MSQFYNRSRPKLPRHYVPYVNSEQWAVEALQSTLTVFWGPAGYGKTSAAIHLAESLESQGVKVAWLRFEAADNVQETLFTHIFQTLNSTLRQEDASIQKAKVSQSSLAEFVERWHETFVLVLDDLEQIHDDACLHDLSRFISQAPQHAHFVIASRKMTGFPLSRLKLEGRLQSIAPQALELVEYQVEQLLNQCYQLDLDAPSLTAIAKKVERWPAGLQMVALFLQSGRPVSAFIDEHAASIEDISNYLWEEVLLTLPQATQAFLMETSFLDRLNGSLCTQVTGRANSAQLIQEIYNANLFLSAMDHGNTTYRYHKLFAEFLRARLQQTQPVEEIIALHQRAADWHLEQGDYATALIRLFEVESWGFAIDVLYRCAWVTMGQGHVRRLLSWFDAIPPTKLHQHPRLMVAYGWALILCNKVNQCRQLVRLMAAKPEATETGEFHLLEPLMLAFEDNLIQCRDAIEQAKVRMPAKATPLAKGTLINTEIMLHLHARNFAVIDPLVAQARTHFLEAGADYGENYAYLFQISSWISQGKLEAAHARAEKNWQRTIEHNQRYSSGSALAGVCLARTSYHRGEIERAIRLVTPHIDILCETTVADTLIDAIRLVSRAHCQNANLEQAGQWLNDCQQLVQERHSIRILNTLEQERQYIQICAFDLGIAQQLPILIASEHDTPKASATPMAEDIETRALQRCRIMLRSNEIEPALAILNRELRENHTSRRQSYLLKLEILQAQALAQIGRNKQAFKHLERCARKAMAEGYISLFREEGPPLADLIHKFCDLLQPSSHLETDHLLIQFLDPASAAKSPLLPDPSTFVHLLSSRERQVAELLSAGLSNNAIATRLSISINTVKFHLKQIYTKSGVSSRAQAISLLERLRLAGQLTSGE